MNVDFIREYCLAFSHSSEKMQWEDDLCFKVGGKIFAVLSLESVPPRLCFKCTPEKFAELCEHEDIIPAPYVGRYKWVLLQRLDVLGEAELRELIGQSYAMVAARAGAKIKGKSSKGKKRKARRGKR